RPEEILALTFTDKAAAEMEERVDTLVPYGDADGEVATFHAFGDRLLREHALELGLQPDFRVLNRAEQVIFLRDRLFQLPLERYRPLGDPTRHIQALITLISRCKDEDIACEEYLAFAERLATFARATPEDAALRERVAQQLELARTYAKYQELMAASGAIDFGDQIVHALRLLRSRPYVLAGLQRRFKHILVDEFQDTNWAQFEIVKLLGARHANVAAVGDDNQAIYRWRGAALSNFRGFLRHFPQATVVVLTENYRSHHRILDPAYRLILNNPDRLEESDEGRRYGVTKKLSAVREPDGPEPRHLHYETATQEADEVARLVQERVAEGAWKYDDVAVRRVPHRGGDPRAARRGGRGGGRGDPAPRRRSHALHGAGARDADRRAPLPVPRGLGLARADVEGRHGAGRGRGAEHLEVLPPRAGRLADAALHQRARVSESPRRADRRGRRPRGRRRRGRERSRPRPHRPQSQTHTVP